MPYIQKTLPPPEQVKSFTLNDFTGGINNATSDTLLNNNEASDILNMAFNEEGTMERRKGFARFNPNSYPSSIQFIDTFHSKDGDKLIVGTGTKLYVNNTEVCDVANTISGTNYLNAYYFVDGASYRVYGKMPIVASTNVVIVGTPVDEYRVWDVVNPPAGFTPLPSPAIMGKWNYSYAFNEMWYEPCALELADTFKGANLFPTKPSILILHGDRLYMNGDDVNPGNVFMTDVHNALYAPVGLPIQMPPDGTEVTGMAVFMDAVIVGRKHDVNVIYGNTNRTSLDSGLFTRKKMNTHAGFMNNDCTSIAHDMLFYLGADNVVYRMLTPQTDVELLCTKVLSSKLNLKEYPFSFTDDELKSMRSIFFKENYYLFSGSLTLVYSYRFQAWTIYNGVPITCATIFNDQLVYGASDGLLYCDGETYDDNDMPYASWSAGKRLDFGLASNYKQIRDIYIVAHVFENYKSDIKVRYEVDYVDVQQVADISNQMSMWGDAVWGDRFITRNITPSLPISIGRRGRKLRVIVMNGQTVKTVFNTYADMFAQLHPVKDSLYKALDVNKFYSYKNGAYTEVDRSDLFQPMKVYEVNGEYQVKEKR